MNTYENQYSKINENTWRSMNIHFLKLITFVERSSEWASAASERVSREWNFGKGNATHKTSGTFLGLTRMPDSERQLTSRKSDRASERAQRASERVSREFNSGKGNAIRKTSGTSLGLTGMPDSERQPTSHRSDRASSEKPTSISQGLILVHIDVLITIWNSF